MSEIKNIDNEDALTVQPAAPIQKDYGAGALLAENPQQFIAMASKVADALGSVIKAQNLVSNIQGKEYVKVEGWTTCIAMLGITPFEMNCMAHDDGSYEAIVELRDRSGGVVGRASAECGGTGDGQWPSRPAYARRSMAITRATSKACRMSFSWIITMAGYNATPAEEMPAEGFDNARNVSPETNQPAPEANTSSETPRCPSCKHSLRTSNGQYKDPKHGANYYYCWKNKGGCGMTFGIEETESGEIYKNTPGSEETIDIESAEVVTEATDLPF